MTLLMLDPREVIAEGNIRITSGTDNADLEASIKRQGVLMPVLVRSNGDGQYTLIAGFRRRAAAEVAGVQLPAWEIPEYDWSDADTLEAQFAENVFREAITPVEKAQVTLDLQEAGLTQRDVAAATGLPQRSIGAWQKLARADLSEVDGAGELNEQQLLELVGEADEDFIAPVVTRFLNEVHVNGGPRFSNLESAYRAEQTSREKEAQMSKLRPLIDELIELGVEINEGYGSEGRTIIDAGDKDAERYNDSAGYIVLDLKAHRGETCHRAYLRDGYKLTLDETCAQPKRHVKADANVPVADAPKIRKAQTKEAVTRKKDREAKALLNDAYGDFLRDDPVSKTDQFQVAIDGTERAFHYDWEKDAVRWLGLETPDPPDGSHRNKWQLAIDAYTEGMNDTKRALFIVKVRIIKRHIEGSWRYSDDDRTTVLSVEAFGKDS